MHQPRAAIVICASLLIAFAVVSFSAIDSKSPTYDEPYHALSAWLQWNRHDFRMDNEDPPLWQYWASLPNGSSALSADFKTSFWTRMPDELTYQWYWGVGTLYRTPVNNPVAFIRRCRVMMLIVSLLLGVTIAGWARQTGGWIAAITATALFACDPNFIAHGSLMKNDIVFTLSMFLLARQLWIAGKQLTGWGIVKIAMLCIFTLTVKFSGVVAVMLVPLLLGVRALLPTPWLVIGRLIQSRVTRLLIAAAVVLICVLISYAGIWAVYGFRFRPTPEKEVWLNITALAWEANRNQIVASYGAIPPPGVPMQAKPGLVIDAVMFANNHGLLPQPYLAGFLFTYANALVRPAFLNGQISIVGWWWYFPFAMLVKTPIATLIAAILAGIFIIKTFFSGGPQGRVDSSSRATNPPSGRPLKDGINPWTAICLALPFALFLASVMRSNFNIGIRHILPIYPFAFVAIGWVVSRVWQRKSARVVCVLLAGGLLIESWSAYPNFIPFFNVVASNTGGGKLDLLGDSNLDWGQDLPLLVDWQKQHPDVPIYLSYFGYADPAYYKIRYTPLPGGYHYDPPPKFPAPYEHCVLAISATNLQGVLEPPDLRPYYRQCRKLKLIDILGGSIYLFEVDPSQNLRGSMSARIEDGR